MGITTRGLNRATLARQLLLAREPLAAPEAVRRVVAVQAQQPSSPYVALWNRVAGFGAAELDEAFARWSVVKATLMRITLHAVHAGDYVPFHEAMRPALRGSRLGDQRFTETGLSAADADALVPELLEFAREPRLGADFEAWLEARHGPLPKPGPWWALRTYAPLWHAPTGGPWSFGLRPRHLAAGRQPRPGDPEVARESLRHLVWRYLEGFGPASVADVAQFALVQRTRVKQALSELSDRLEQFPGPDGTTLFDVPDGPRPADDVPAPPRLMAMWDSTLLAYADRGRVIPPEYRRLVIRVNGDVLPTVLVDGYVAGVWRAVEGGVEVTAFHPLGERVWDELSAEAAALMAFLADREPRVYGRYDHWWAKLPEGETRRLG